MSLLTYTCCNVNVHMVALRKLVMSVAGGVPCVGSTFFMPVSERKYYMAKNFLTYEQQLHILEYDKQLAIPNHEYATKNWKNSATIL